jgi:hypothetical protein
METYLRPFRPFGGDFIRFLIGTGGDYDYRYLKLTQI